MSPARARSRSARSRVERTNHEANAPFLPGWFSRFFLVLHSQYLCRGLHFFQINYLCGDTTTLNVAFEVLTQFDITGIQKTHLTSFNVRVKTNVEW